MSDHGVGASPARVGGLDRVTGRQAYVADIRLEGVLHTKLVTLDCARKRSNGCVVHSPQRRPSASRALENGHSAACRHSPARTGPSSA